MPPFFLLVCNEFYTQSDKLLIYPVCLNRDIYKTDRLS